MAELENRSSLRLIKTFGRLKGRPLSKNQKFGLKIHKEKYDFSLKTKKKVTVEIENLRQLNNVLGLKFNRILFDNVSLAQLKKYLKICKDKYETEYSGNANLKNITKISKTGVNRISVGSITHSAKSFDSSLLIF